MFILINVLNKLNQGVIFAEKWLPYNVAETLRKVLRNI